MSKRKRNRELKKELESNDYLQTNPTGAKNTPGSTSPRQNPRNLPTENASMKEDLSDRLQKNAEEDRQQKKLEGGERGE